MDDGILPEAIMTAGKTESPETPDPIVEQFVELRKYIEHSHDGLSRRLEKVEAGQERLERKFDGRIDGLERKLDAGFDRLGRKINALTSTRRRAPRRRKP
jgi:hypothetical protein